LTGTRPSSDANAAQREPTGLRAGIGLRAAHDAQVIELCPPIAWLEVHSENHFARGGAQREVLAKVREHYALSLHGVGLSIGSTDALDEAHLAEIVRLERDFGPVFVSEHLSWGSVGGRFLNDLLPLPYTEEALRHMVSRVDQVQHALGRQILIENIASYVAFKHSSMAEWEFLAALVQESGCGLLLDVNNVYVNAMNHGFDPHLYLQHIPVAAVQEIHLAGHSIHQLDGRQIRIDTHGSPVSDEVWALYASALDRFGPVPTLIEWDTDIPPLDVLLAEARKADDILESRDACAA
jgi:uncharacterized protein (UPF0276 family)